MQIKTLQSIETTNALKGIAISAVLINHYLNLNISIDGKGFANAWLSVFFFLSGYGLFYSLNSRELRNARDLLLFYYQRVVRLFPLLWLAWIIEVITTRGKMSLWTLTGIHGSGHYWFIPALLQCYLVSPLIYLGIKKKFTIFIFSFLLVLVLVNYLGHQAPPIILKRAAFFHLRWRQMFFFHILFFMLGMLFPLIIIPSKKRYSGLVSISLFWVFTFFITIFMIALKIYSQSNSIAKLSFNIAPLFLITLLCAYSLYYSIRIQCLEYLGSISYSVYLFHMSYYKSISDMGAFPKNSVKELIAYIIVFPIFIFICWQMENLGNYISRKLRSLVLVNADKADTSVAPHSTGVP